MTIEEIKTQIRALPRKEIGPLLQWLRKHFDEELLERQIAADIALLGEAEYVRLLLSGMARTDEQRQVALRIVGCLSLAPKHGNYLKP
jgi:hypothetical protein